MNCAYWADTYVVQGEYELKAYVNKVLRAVANNKAAAKNSPK